MTNRSRLAAVSAIAVLLVLSLAFLFTVSGQRQQGDKDSSKEPAGEVQWEYLVVSGGNVNLTSVGGELGQRKQPEAAFAREASVLQRNLDKLGLKGWELITVHGSPNEPIYYLKRPKETR